MNRTIAILVAVVLYIFIHWAIYAASQKTSRVAGKGVGKLLRPLLTSYYRKNVVTQMQEQRKKDGLPPLENPYLD